jgi:DNA polymerase elongation subunit (family B)
MNNASSVLGKTNLEGNFDSLLGKSLGNWDSCLRANNPITHPLDTDLIVQLTDWHCTDSWELNAERNGEDPNKIRDKYRWKPKGKKGSPTETATAAKEAASLVNANKKKIVIDRYGKLVAVDATEITDLLDDSVADSISELTQVTDTDTSPEPTEIDEDEEDEAEKTDRYDDTFKIIGFGLTPNNESVTLQLDGFKPYFFIKVPENWNSGKVDELIENVKKGFKRNVKTAKFAYAISAWKLIQAKPFRDFTGSDLFNYVRLTFCDKESWTQWSNAFRRPIRLWSYNGGEAITYALFESNINPLLRFLHIQAVSPSGWIIIKRNDYSRLEPGNPQRISRAQLEVTAQYKNVHPYEVPADQPAITKMIIASYDIEANSSHGDFPIAKKDYQKLAQDLISESGKLYPEGKESLIHQDPLLLVRYWLECAFNKYHGAYNINSVSLLDKSLGKTSLNDSVSLLDKSLKDNKEQIKELIDRIVDDELIAFFDKYSELSRKVEKPESHDDDEPSISDVLETVNLEEQQILEELVNMQRELTEMFVQNFPPVSTSHAHTEVQTQVQGYELLAIQLLSEYSKNKRNNNQIFVEEPLETLKYMLNLAFSGIWNAHSINRIYTTAIPDKATIDRVSIDVWKVLKNCNEFLRNKELKRSQKKKSSSSSSSSKTKVKANSKVKGGLTNGISAGAVNAADATKTREKEKERDKEMESRNRNYYVEDLTKVLNARLLKNYPVIGDNCIQIGTTFQRYGDPHPWLKHIIVLNSCESIENSRIISDEHKDINFPTKELIGLLSGIRKELKLLAEQKLKMDQGSSTTTSITPSITPSITMSTSMSTTMSTSFDKSTVEEETPINMNKPEEQYLLSLPDNQDEFEKALKALSKEDPKRLKQLNNFVLDWNKKIQLQEDNSIVVVESYNTEAEVLLAWTRLIQQVDPDFIIGYNIFGFDFDFLYQRSEALNIANKFGQLGRIKGVRHKLFVQELSSSGLGENILKYIPMYGRVLIDMFKVVQANYRLPIYKLDFVCKHFLYKSKNDLPPKEIFILQKGSASDRRKIAEYCLIDCILVNRLINKLEIITNQIGMSNVCMVPLPYLFLRGQGVKILSLVSMYCRKEGFLLPVLKKPDQNEESYEGAVVLPPQSAIFFEPVAVSDFNSLYPSSIIAENLCHTSITTKGGKYDNLPGHTYCDITYDRYKYEPIPGKKKIRKVKVGVETCRFVQLPDGQKSLLPRIEQNLLSARASTRNDQKAFPKDSFQWKVKEGLQLAYKLTANSLYGQVGAKTSAIYYKNIAACTTATGRGLIHFTKKYFETNYDGAVTVYGDSVTGDTPILVRDSITKKIWIERIDKIGNLGPGTGTGSNATTDINALKSVALDIEKGNWRPYPQFKPEDNHTVRWNKEQNLHLNGLTVWSSNGWTPIKRVIRHMTSKDIYRVTTNQGSVDVTEDHSLLTDEMQQIKPEIIRVGMTRLLHGYPVSLLGKSQENLRDFESEITNDGGDAASFVFRQYIAKLMNIIRYLGSTGFNDANNNQHRTTITIKDKLHAAKIHFYAHCLGYKASVEHVTTGFYKLRLYPKWVQVNEQDNIVKSIIKLQKLNSSEYVYDLETVTGNFHAGVGSLIVKNTDSVFEKFKCVDAWNRPLRGLDAIFKSMEYSIEGSQAVSRLLKPPHNLEFEKAIWPFILITKKRYHGHYYTSYGSADYYPNSMGIALKRRDNAPIVKKVLGSTIDIIMKEHDVQKAISLGQQMARDLLAGKYPMDDFIITKTLRSFYKTPMSIAHNVLAMRIAKRDPGNKPQANDRIAYAYIVTPKVPKGTKVLQGECIETPQYIKENHLKLNYKFYLTNQIMKPVSQIFALVTDDLAHLFYDAIRDYDYKIAGVRKILDFPGYKAVPIDKTAYANLNKQIKELQEKSDSESHAEDGDEDDDGSNKDDDEDAEVDDETELDDRQEEIVGLAIAEIGGDD